jgi:hypothetical protein
VTELIAGLIFDLTDHAFTRGGDQAKLKRE